MGRVTVLHEPESIDALLHHPEAIEIFMNAVWLVYFEKIQGFKKHIGMEFT